MDMAAAFSTFTNRGIRVPPVLVTRITRADGTVLFSHEHTQTKVLEAGVADTVTSILEQVVQRGTGTKAQLDRPAAGKTGTTDDHRDAWFVGYTPELATSVWVGFPKLGPDGKKVRMQPPTTPIRVTGGSYPAEIWRTFMGAALAGRPPTAFPVPTTTTTLPPVRPAPLSPTPAPPAPVPDVRGLPVAEATAKVRAAGFEVVVVPAAGSKVPDHDVVVQAPVGGTAPRGSVVTLEVR
jgi:penicillin-binding protein 1A